MTLVGELMCFGHGEVGDTSAIRSGDEASVLPLGESSLIAFDHFRFGYD